MKNLNERQAKLITDLQDAFGKMNGSTTAKGRLLDIQAIHSIMDESESIKKEVELYNEKLRSELYCKFESEFKMLSEDLEELGLRVEMDKWSSEELFLSVKHFEKDPFNSKKPRLTNSVFANSSFYVTAKILTEYIKLPNGEKIGKIKRYCYELGSLNNFYFNSIEDLVNFYVFKDWINYSLVENNKYKK